jgi:class 3 adenylate cyclase/ABC-type transport system involved in cytochrome c biogenesis ATPase subunit
MCEIREWLAEIQMSRFTDAFLAHGIDLQTARELTAEDLKEMGINRLGDRKALLREIGRLAEATSHRDAHRRILSVLFCDLVSSTELSRQVDAEDLRIVLKAYHERARYTILRFGGFIGRLLGDGVLAYFGWPHAQEDQAAQAVRAALDLVGAIRGLRFDSGVVVHCRVGIATGRVVIGEETDPELAFGETLNLAARLQTHATPDSVIIDEATGRWIGRRFATLPLPPATMKGFGTPVRIWQVLEEHPSVDRFESRAPGRAGFVDREAEMHRLAELWTEALSGDGRFVFVSGAPGLGKSRLVREFTASVAEQARILRLQCSAHHTTSGFHPLIHRLEAAAGADAGKASPPAVRRELARLLGEDVGAEPAEIASVAKMLDLSIGESAEPSAISARERRAFAIAFLARTAVQAARPHPLLIIVEDAHWIDPSTQELLEALISRLAGTRLLVIATTRPGATALANTSTLAEIGLDRLPNADTELIVRGIEGSARFSDHDVSLIVSRVEGVPLFAEELASAAIDHGQLGALDELPETVEASLTARLDFLTHGKAVAQLGSILGREFASAELKAMAGPSMTPASVERGLRELTAARLAVTTATSEEPRYRFSHALVQEVAYASLLRHTRQRMHERAARDVLPEPVRSRQPELIAHHLTEAGLVTEALEYWRLAGQRSAEKSANAEAISHFRRGLALAETLPDGPSRDRTTFRLLVALSGPLIAELGYTSSELGDCIARAMALSERIAHPPEIYPLLYARWASLLTSGSMAQSLQVAQAFSGLAERQHHEDALLSRHRMLGASHLCLGHLSLASRELDALVHGYEPDRHASLVHSYGVDLRVAGLCFRSEVLWLTGHVDRALAAAAAALREARACEHVNSIAMALHFCGLVSFLNRDPSAVHAYAGEMTELTRRQPAGAWPLLTAAMVGWALVAEQHPEEGITMLIDGVERALRAGVSMFVPIFYCRIAETYIETKDLTAAAVYVSSAEELVGRTGEVNFRGELLRLRALLRHRRGLPASAHRILMEAITVARGQGARSIELRAATSLADILTDRGESERAVTLLALLLEERREGRRYPDFLAAQAALVRARGESVPGVAAAGSRPTSGWQTTQGLGPGCGDGSGDPAAPS